ncbi:MAG: glycosyltransferase [Lachnospiraceae bacterium]|nr:glycosyltransferase [Lachnospiraceae bacterium]
MNGNIGKTLNYLKRNGPVETFYAIRERLWEKKKLPPYTYVPVSEEERLRQLEDGLSFHTAFSILVPAFETPETYLREMIDSVREQTYPKWELIIADASLTDTVKNIAGSYDDIRIRYVKLPENGGISENTNGGLAFCTGDYTGLLDHDDLLTVDALYEMAKAIEKAKNEGIKLQALYSDEDKTDSENKDFFEINEKPKFNLDLILSNNYICHFLVLETGLLKEMKLRKEFDGAQDHDLILRTVHTLMERSGAGYEKEIFHIGKVLYHWRCHDASTAANPKSKSYAYDRGQEAVADFIRTTFAKGAEVITETGRKTPAGCTPAIIVRRTPHMGFFDVEYRPDVFTYRSDICAVGGRILDRDGKVAGGAYNENKKLLFEGLDERHSGGYLHRAACKMEVPYLDTECMCFPEEGKDIHQAAKILKTLKEENSRSCAPLDRRLLSFRFCDIMREKGCHFIYDPEMILCRKP